MKTILPFFLLLGLFSCDEAPIVAPLTYACELSFPTHPESHPQAAAFEELINEFLPFTTGIQVALRSADGQSWTGASGYADIPNNIRLAPCHRFLIASISKMLTATLILQLQDENLVSIDDPLSDYLGPDLIGRIANAEAVSLRQLLNHTSGIPDYLNIRQFINGLNQPFFLETQREKLVYVHDEPAEFAPGADFSYSNTNYVLLGLVVEQLRSMPLWEAVDQYIAAPLGLGQLAMGTEDNPIPNDVARPYLATLGGRYFDFTETAVSDAATGDGGILSNMQDLNRFALALFEEQLLSGTALEQMTTDFQILESDESDFSEWPDEGYSLGVTRYNTPFGTAWGHTGNSSSYNSSLFYFPENGAILSIVYNGIDLERIDELIDKNEALRDAFFGLIQ